MLSPKYIAGFFDSDGSVSVVHVADCKTPQLRIRFAQKTEQDEVLHLIQKDWGGHVGYTITNGVSYTHLTYSGNKQCSMLLNRIKQFLVIKRHYVEVCLDVCSRQIEKTEIEKVKAYLKVHRKQKSLPLPKHPTRKWLAGYIDGDGCISVQHIDKSSGNATLVLHIAAAEWDTEGIEIIQKQFGGTIHDMKGKNVKQWKVTLQPSKAIQIFESIVESMVVKQNQVKLLLKCAAMGHFRDGNNIKAAMKHLKAHPHRLNEPKPNLGELFKTIRDLPKYVRPRESYLPKAMRQSEQSVGVLPA